MSEYQRALAHIEDKKELQRLIVMCGLPASGKSIISLSLAEKYNAKIISSDNIRQNICKKGRLDQTKNEEVFKILHEKVRKLLTDGKSVIIDATNITIKERKKCLEDANGLDDVFKVCYVCAKRIDQCRIDNVNREYPVPDGVIDRMVSKWQVPFYEEGFDSLIRHNYDEPVIEPKYYEQMKGFDQQNPNHTHTLDIHSDIVYKNFFNNPKYYTSKYINQYALGVRYHDLGKLFTQTFDDDEVAHYYQHANYSSYILLSEFYDVHWNDCFVANYHMFPFSWVNEKTHEKWKKIFGEEKYNLLIWFNKCDQMEEYPEQMENK